MRYDFGEYMTSLLFAPLKKARDNTNQFRIFFRVVGRVMQSIKDDIMRVRAEASVVTASPVMLPVHGQDREMQRLAGETVEGYRNRLAAKGVIAQAAGMDTGIRYLARSFGYDNVEVNLLDDAERWAEAEVRFIGGDIVLDDRELLLQELNKIKPARTVLTFEKEQRYEAQLYFAGGLVVGKQITIRQG
jgi:hypothetical protein